MAVSLLTGMDAVFVSAVVVLPLEREVIALVLAGGGGVVDMMMILWLWLTFFAVNLFDAFDIASCSCDSTW